LSYIVYTYVDIDHSKYPKVKLIYGDLEATDLIEETAATSDIIYHFANCDHEISAHAIAKGLARRTSDTPGFWIHTSGAMILAHETIQLAEFGRKLDKIFNDWDGEHELVSQPDGAAHRVVDKIVLAAGDGEKTKVAIVCPPTIWGRGRGPDNYKSMQIEHSTRAFLKAGKAFKLGKSENIWNQVHVQDLAELYLLLVSILGGSGRMAAMANIM
jgi:hypothetical protein